MFSNNNSPSFNTTYLRLDTRATPTVASWNDMMFPNTNKAFTTMEIAQTTVKRVLDDCGSGINIINPRVIKALNLYKLVKPTPMVLTGVNSTVELAQGEILLLVMAGGIETTVTFYVINKPNGYNAIIGRPWIHAMQMAHAQFFQRFTF